VHLVFSRAAGLGECMGSSPRPMEPQSGTSWGSSQFWNGVFGDAAQRRFR
jgi:hypothetical protein